MRKYTQNLVSVVWWIVTSDDRHSQYLIPGVQLLQSVEAELIDKSVKSESVKTTHKLQTCALNQGRQHERKK